MARYTKVSLGSNYASKQQIDQNLDAIATAIDDTLSRKGDQPNTMEAELDMNSNRILNLPDAIQDQEPVTLQQFNTGAIGTKTTQTLRAQYVATSGQTVFTTPLYVPSSNNLHVYINGVRQDATAYTETNASSITLTEGVQAGDIVQLVVNELQELVGQVGATSVTYEGSTVAARLDDMKHYNTVALAKTDINLAVGAKVKTWGYSSLGDGGGAEYRVVAAATGTADEGSYHDMTNGLQLALITESNKVDVKVFGAVPEVDCKTQVESLLSAGFTPVFGKGAWLLNNITMPDNRDIECIGGEEVVFKKNANGYIFDLGRYCKVLGGPSFVGDFSSSGYTGSSVVISRGDNSATLSLQGHQRIFDASFDDSEDYHVNYTVPNKGYLSRLVRCKFLSLPANAPASVKWADETAIGGNRYIDGGYSKGPVCNVSGADNGAISFVTTGSDSNPTNQGVYFDPASTNPPKKIAFVGNRFAIGGKEINVLGIDHSFSSNIINGDVKFEAGVINSSFSDDNIFSSGKSIIDNSGNINFIQSRAVFFTPTIKSGITLGNGTLQGEYKRDGQYVDFRIELDFGSTTSVTGSMIFDLPLPVVSGGTRTFTGSAWGASFAGRSYIEQASNQVTVYRTGSTAGVWNATIPKVWTTGDKAVIEGRYRL